SSRPPPDRGPRPASDPGSTAVVRRAGSRVVRAAGLVQGSSSHRLALENIEPTTADIAIEAAIEDEIADDRRQLWLDLSLGIDIQAGRTPRIAALIPPESSLRSEARQTHRTPPGRSRRHGRGTDGATRSIRCHPGRLISRSSQNGHSNN